MIKYYKNEEIDFKKWDECISKSLNSLIYANSWYLNLVAENWDALIEGDYQSVMPLVYRKKFGIYYIFPPFFTQQLGVFSKDIITSKKLEDFLKAIPLHFKYIEIHLNNENIYKIESSFSLIKNKNYVLELNNNYEIIKSKYSENLKRNLKKAEKNNLKITENIKPEDIINLFRNNKGKEFLHLKDNDYKRLNRLIYSLLHKGNIKTYGVYNLVNNLCSGAVFLFYKNRVIFIFSATDNEAKRIFAMPSIIDNFIKTYSYSGLILDFEGSNDQNLARFYKSFGSKEDNYHTVIINRLPLLLRYFFLLRKKIKKLMLSKI